MKLLGKQRLQEFKRHYANARPQINSWEAEIEEAEWETPHDLKAKFPKASLLKDQQVIFNIGWNKYRILTTISYKSQMVLVEKIGTHREYDNW